MTNNIDPLDDDFPSQPHLDDSRINDSRYWVGTNKPQVETHYSPLNRREAAKDNPDEADYIASDEDLDNEAPSREGN